jgi:hypothetical protein
MINFFQKPIAGILLFIIIFSLAAPLFLFHPKKAEATWPTFEWGSFAANWGKFFQGVWEIAKDTAIAYFKKALLDRIVTNIIGWINGEGDPQFVTDWKGFTKDVADEAGGMFLNTLTRTDLCSVDWAPAIKISLAKPQRFETRYKCSLSKIGVNFNDFMKNFSNGGWKGWISVTEEQNNPYGVFLAASDANTIAQAAGVDAVNKQVNAGAGFLGDERCKQIEICGTNDLTFESNCMTETGDWAKADIPKAESDSTSSETITCTKWETRTPGKIMADMTYKSVGKDMDWLLNQEEWTSYVVAITDALINRLVKEGVGAITKKDVEGTSNMASTDLRQPILEDRAPTSAASPAGPWRAKIDITSSGLAMDADNGTASQNMNFLYYTLDGSEPVFSPSNPDLSFTYSGPIEITSSTTLKWMTRNLLGLQEPTHTEYLDPPFAENPLETAVVAVGAQSLALRTNQAAAIYYTIDGSTPTAVTTASTTTASTTNAYIKKIDLGSNAQITLNWFGVGADGTTEAMHTKTLTPPFPGGTGPGAVSDFYKIGDLTTPVATISAPSGVSGTGSFTLDPTLSKDNDRSNRIVMYEWDLDNDGIYDWSTTDYNRDSVFEWSRCKDGNSVCSGGSSIGNGFISMSSSGRTLAVSYAAGLKTIRLRVTDDEGLSAETTAVVNIQ